MGNIILGIDPSSTLTGFCVLDMDAAKISSTEPFAKVLLLSEVRISGRDRHDKIEMLGDRVEDVINEFGAKFVAIEAGYVGQNPAVALLLGEIRGACVYAARRHTPDVYQGSPREIRCAIGIKGKQKKRELGKFDVLNQVIRLLRLTTCPKENAADAAATAIWGGLKVSEPVPF